ncbi:MAG: STELLO glycosyltransferase family protein [Cyanobacteria bacterium P01_G01_bin.19]
MQTQTNLGLVNHDRSTKTQNFIIITSIYPPTKAVRDFAKREDHQLVVVGDRKTPQDWQWEGTSFLSVDRQSELDSQLFELLPYNHYGRKNLGYIYAMQQGAKIIIDTDDDNIPKQDWHFPSFAGNYRTTPQDLGYINIYQLFTEQHIWPRGFPLDLINHKFNDIQERSLPAEVKVGVWQGLADGDPDVDAIYRLVSNTPCFFEDRQPVVLSQGTLCPFNSQNTAFIKELFPLLYLPCFVTFRYTDILRGLIAQPIIWAAGYSLGFTKATVVQERNPHDYMKDFESEIPCFMHPYKVAEIVQDSVRDSYSVSDNLYQAYSALEKANIVTDREMKLVSLWLEDIQQYS